MLNTEQLRHLMTLRLTPGLGVERLNKILQHHSIEEFLSLDRLGLEQLKLKPNQIDALRHPNQSLISRVEQWQQQQSNRQVLSYYHCGYPAQLKQISSAPLILFIEGDSALLHGPQLAIIGSRNLTISGQDNAFNFAKQLAALGIIITSGLAIGVDGHSHRGALDGKGKTIAVLGTGLAQVYPKRHKALAHQISQQGALVSEFLPDQTARPENFPRRNRIISGLSQGTLVIEATIKSGSLITARYALEQNREVFAVPGPIRNPMSHGCHYLIKQGAKLTENIDDILEELPQFQQFLANQVHPVATSTPSAQAVDPEHPLIGHIGYEPTTVDCIVQRSLLPVNDVMAQLLGMELSGLIAATADGYVRL